MINANNIETALENIGSDTKLTQADYNKPFNEIGLDSLDVFNLFSELELVTGKVVSDDDFQTINTLQDIIDYLNK